MDTILDNKTISELPKDVYCNYVVLLKTYINPTTNNLINDWFVIAKCNSLTTALSIYHLLQKDRAGKRTYNVYNPQTNKFYGNFYEDDK